MFVRQWLRDRRKRLRLEEFVSELNESLRAPRSRKGEAEARYEVTERLSKDGMLRLFDFSVERQAGKEGGAAPWQVRLSLKQEAWARRRRYDGFVLLVGHEKLPHTTAELALLYRAKDAIERGFRVIKSEIELRPLYHRADEKIRAHVTICMLALLLERALESRLKAAGRPMPAATCLESLASCCLDRYPRDEVLERYYSVTRPDSEQQAILKSLGLTELTDIRKVCERITPRDA